MKFETFSNFLPNWTVLQLARITKMQLRVHVKRVLVDQQSIQSDWSTKGTFESLHGAVFALVMSFVSYAYCDQVRPQKRIGPRPRNGVGT